MSYSLYIHIPFCKRKCNYCDFPSYAGKEDLISEYLEALKAESGYISSLYDHPKVRSIYIGGGTPTILTENQIEMLFETIFNDFEVPSKTETTVEANPGTVTKEKLSALRKFGANRISLGAQTFKNDLLRKLGRIHLEHEIAEAFEMIREAGFKNINLDLMFALPGESLKDWSNTLTKAIALKPEHFSVYNLQLEEGTPLYNEKLDGNLKLPDEEDELEMYKTAIDTLSKNGYKQYEISNFAKNGFECAHNLTYWTLEEYIGLGAGAHSYIAGSRIENTSFIDKYLTKDLAKIKTEHKNTKKENMQEMIFLGLRMIKGFSLNDFTARFGISFRELYKKEIEELESDGLLEIKGKNALLTQKGLFLANEVFKKFL
jgi:oxygen-independent coproporphyrinogen-3 oxidase